MIEIFTIKFLTGDTILKPRTKVASGNKTEILNNSPHRTFLTHT